jgi:ABC-type glutathione transport system ATPase component
LSGPEPIDIGIDTGPDRSGQGAPARSPLPDRNQPEPISSATSPDQADRPDQPGQPPMLEMRGITKRFPGVLANDDVSFDLRAGEVHTLLGENGAGKSTLVKCIVGYYRPDDGDLLIDDHERSRSSSSSTSSGGYYCSMNRRQC